MSGFNQDYRKMTISEVARIVAYVINGRVHHGIPFNNMDLSFVVGGACERNEFAYVSEKAYRVVKEFAPRMIIRSVNGMESALKYLTQSQLKKNCQQRIVHEHSIPRKMLCERLLEMANDHELSVDECEDFLLHFARVALIVKEEDDMLTDAKLKSDMPAGWNFDMGDPTARYDTVGIKLHVWERTSEN